ncbi:hypothetical protein ABPG75_001262 [Micractinium tetrahymenae]
MAADATDAGAAGASGQEPIAPLPTLGMKTFGGVGVDYWGAVLIAAAVGTVALVYLWFVFLKWRAGRGRMNSVAAGQLRLAATRGRVQDLALLARLPDFQVDADLLGFTPLHAACVQGHPGAVVWLLQRGADLARLKQDGWRDTALHYAAGSGSMDCVQALLAWGADATLANALGALPADVAEKARHHSLAGYLRSVAAAATATAAQATAAGAADSSSSSASGAEPGNANGEGGHESTEGSGASAVVAAADEGAAGNAESSPNLPEIPSKEELIKRHIMDPFRAARTRLKQSKLDLLAEFTEAGEAVAKAEEASPVQDSPAPGSQATGSSQASVAPGSEAAASMQASAAIVPKTAGAARGGEAGGRGSTAAERERKAALQRLVQRGFEGLGTPGTVPKRETRLFRPLAVLTQVRPAGKGLAEFLAYCMSYCFVTSLFNMIERPERRVREMLPPERIPHVDVFICTYSGKQGPWVLPWGAVKPVDIVEPTAVAALNMNWPGSKLTVHILDDSNRPEMARLVRRLTFQCK